MRALVHRAFSVGQPLYLVLGKPMAVNDERHVRLLQRGSVPPRHFAGTSSQASAISVTSGRTVAVRHLIGSASYVSLPACATFVDRDAVVTTSIAGSASSIPTAAGKKCSCTSRRYPHAFGLRNLVKRLRSKSSSTERVRSALPTLAWTCHHERFRAPDAKRQRSGVSNVPWPFPRSSPSPPSWPWSTAFHRGPRWPTSFSAPYHSWSTLRQISRSRWSPALERAVTVSDWSPWWLVGRDNRAAVAAAQVIQGVVPRGILGDGLAKRRSLRRLSRHSQGRGASLSASTSYRADILRQVTAAAHPWTGRASGASSAPDGQQQDVLFKRQGGVRPASSSIVNEAIRFVLNSPVTVH